MRVRGVNKVRAKGRVYYYHRKARIRIQAEFGTAAFLAEIERLNGIASAIVPPRSGSLGALIEAYRKSPEFKDRAPRTKADYQKVFDWLYPVRDKPLLGLAGSFVIGLRDAAYEQRKRRFANYVLAVLGLLFVWGKPRGWLEDNPAKGVEMLPRARGAKTANRPWTWDEFDVVLTAAPVELKPAIALGLFLREGDVIRAAWSSYDGSALQTRQEKTGDLVWTPLPPFVRVVIDRQDRRSPVIVVGERGRPFQTTSGFRARFFKLIRGLKACELVTEGLTFHGLRHSMGTWLADRGANVREIGAVLGHRTDAMASHYSKGASKRRAATSAIERLEQTPDGFAKPDG